jgi:PAS domain-containing protein
MDPRLEVREIWKHFNRYHNTIGEGLIYYQFDAKNSKYDRVYDEGYRRYLRGVRIPVLWLDQQEATEDYSPEGRRPTQRLRLAVSAQSLYEAGISVTEAHGNRLQDTSPSEIWRNDRVHDIVYYDGRYYEISGFQIRGRVKGEDVIIGISCIETFPDDDMIFDYTPGDLAIEMNPL